MYSWKFSSAVKTTLDVRGDALCAFKIVEKFTLGVKRQFCTLSIQRECSVRPKDLPLSKMLEV